jgi:hypothetical protein
MVKIKKRFIITLSIFLAIICLLLIAYPFIEIDTGKKIIVFGYNDDVSKYEDVSCYDESYFYVEDKDIDLTEDDYKTLIILAKNIKRGIQWDKIFLLPPKNNFVDDGCRHMKQSSMEERTKNYNILVQLLKDFGWWEKVEIINGDFLQNFNTVKNYINSKLS